jgi:pimeloyl-ACP methyl ester carboxylesterase
MTRPRSRVPVLLAVAISASSVSCLTLDAFLFDPKPVEDFRWDDDDPCDGDLIGDLENARAEKEGREPRCRPSIIPPEDRTEGFLELENRKVHFVYARASDENGEPSERTIFYSHGRKWHMGWYWARVELMWSLGYNVMIYDYPGYGLSTGDVLDEHTIYENAEAVLLHLLTLPGVDPERVWYYGFSLGGGPNYEMAHRSLDEDSGLPRPAGIISEAAFCSIEFLVQDGSFLDLPASFVADVRFDNCAKLDDLSTRAPEIPLMIVHGEADDYVLPTHADALLRNAHNDLIHAHHPPKAEHGDIPVAAPDYERWLVDFIDASEE